MGGVSDNHTIFWFCNKGANPLSGKSKGARYSESRTDTILGVGVRIDGNINFAGVLRNQGDILGDISCDADPNGTIVVAKSGKVTGTIKAAHLVVSGRVDGHVESSESVDIQPGACVVGDVSYKNIAIHAGGVIDGTLIPMVLTEADRSVQEQPIPTWEPPEEYELPIVDAVPAGTAIVEGARKWRKFGVAFVLLAAVATIVLVNRNSTAVTAPVADDSPKANSSATATPATNPPPAEGAVRQDNSRTATKDAVPLAPQADASTKKLVQAPPSDRPEVNSEQTVTVQGENPSKSADFLFVSSGEPCVLIKKKREDPTEGTRIDVVQGASKRIAVARNEILRVAQGQDIDIFYQGRKVGPKAIQGGVWMNFVPYSAGGTSDNE